MPYKNNPSKYFQQEIAAGSVANIGDQLWCEYAKGIIVPVIVQATDDVVEASPSVVSKYQLNTKYASLWVETSLEFGINVTGSHATKTTAGGWSEVVYIDPADLDEQCVWHNRFLGVDEIFGHSVQPDGMHGVWLTFDECYRNASVIDKRQAHRRHKKLAAERRRATAFVNSTHIRVGLEPRCPLITTVKKIYVKTRR